MAAACEEAASMDVKQDRQAIARFRGIGRENIQEQAVLTVGKGPPMGYLPAIISRKSCSLSCGQIGLLSSRFHSTLPIPLSLFIVLCT